MIPRYTRPAMGAVWSDQAKYQAWLEVELASVETLAETGVVPPEDARLLRQHAPVQDAINGFGGVVNDQCATWAAAAHDQCSGSLVKNQGGRHG